MKKRLGILAILLVTCLSTACGDGENDEDKALVRRELNLYYANAAYIESGNEETDRLIGPVEHVLSVTQSDADSTNRLCMMLVDDILREPPPDNLRDAVTMVGDRIVFNAASVNDGIAYIDINAKTPDGEPLDGGATEELLFIEQVTFSLIDSFETVSRVQFLVDSTFTETLMGQMDISEPFDKESFGAPRAASTSRNGGE